MSSSDEYIDFEDSIDPEEIINGSSYTKRNPSIVTGKHRKRLRVGGKENDIDTKTLFDEEVGQGLNYKQRKAIMFITAFNYTDEDVAAELDIPVAKVARWKTKKKFINALYATEKQLSVDAIQKRRINNNTIIDKIHDAIMLKVMRGDLDKYSLGDLIKLLKTVSEESRTDDKNALPKKVEVHQQHTMELTDIQKAYNIRANRDKLRERLLDEQDSTKFDKLEKWRKENKEKDNE